MARRAGGLRPLTWPPAASRRASTALASSPPRPPPTRCPRSSRGWSSGRRRRWRPICHCWAASYRFLDDATKAHARGRRGAVAALLSEWLTEQRWQPEEAVSVHPHLALLYLIAADLDQRANMLSRRSAGWYFADTPLVVALDDRLRGLGYDVWDEAYRDDESRLHALSVALVEQGLSLGVLRVGESPAPLEASAKYGYYEAVELLDAQSLSRRRP